VKLTEVYVVCGFFLNVYEFFILINKITILIFPGNIYYVVLFKEGKLEYAIYLCDSYFLNVMLMIV